MNWKRIALSTVVAAIVMFVLEGVAGMLLTAKIYSAMMERLHLTMPMDASAIGVDILFTFIYSGLIAWMYAAFRAQFGPGPKTALLAGFAAWLPLSLIGTGYQVDMKMMSMRDGVVLSITALVIACIAALVAGALYRPVGAAKSVSA